jgi:putative PIN family toxin of toxin-antitoxin system
LSEVKRESKRAVPDMKPVVLDTNIVLDMFVFNDSASQPIKSAVECGAVQWIATPVMRDELARVLAYPHIVAKLAFYKISAESVLAQFDQRVQLQPVAARAPVVCKDPDDQKFIDLAVAHRAMILSKDNAVLCMKKRLLSLGAIAQAAIS